MLILIHSDVLQLHLLHCHLSENDYQLRMFPLSLHRSVQFRRSRNQQLQRLSHPLETQQEPHRQDCQKEAEAQVQGKRPHHHKAGEF